MRVCREIDFNDLQNMVWSGAEDTVENIANANMEDELMGLLEENFSGNVPTETEINDFLWFDSELVYENLGLNEDGKTEEGAFTELLDNTIKRMDESDDFESFCDDCENCALDRMGSIAEHCKQIYQDYKNGEINQDDWEDMVI